MITTNRTATSADVRGGADAMWASVAPFGSTGLSTSACAVAPAAGVVLDTRVPATAALHGKRREQAIAERFLAPTYLPTNDGTTLGIHSPGRPQS